MALETRLLAAHDRRDGPRLARLYAEASEAAEAAEDRERAAFYLTHAWVFALESGLESADAYRQKLVSWRRVV